MKVFHPEKPACRRKQSAVPDWWEAPTALFQHSRNNTWPRHSWSAHWDGASDTTCRFDQRDTSLKNHHDGACPIQPGANKYVLQRIVCAGHTGHLPNQRLWLVPCAVLAARPPTCLQNRLPQVCVFDNAYALHLPASLKLGTRIHSAQPAGAMWHHHVVRWLRYQHHLRRGVQSSYNCKHTEQLLNDLEHTFAWFGGKMIARGRQTRRRFLQRHRACACFTFRWDTKQAGPIYNRFNLQQDEFESTNIMICIMTEILIIVVLSDGVSCGKGCCRRFGRIFEKCRWFEIIDNILTETLSMISNTVSPVIIGVAK